MHLLTTSGSEATIPPDLDSGLASDLVTHDKCITATMNKDKDLLDTRRQI